MRLAFLLLGGFLAADAPKVDAPKYRRDLPGIWVPYSGTNGSSCFAGNPARTKETLTVRGGVAEWTDLPFFLKAGKGKLTLDQSRKPPTIELKTDGATYRGIYRTEKNADGKEFLSVLFSEAGGEFPKEFGPRPWQLPKGFKGNSLSFQRKK